MKTTADIFFDPDHDPTGFMPALVMDRSKQDFPPEIRIGDQVHPVKYFWKEALPTGRIIDSQGKDNQVAPERIDRIVSDYARARAKGYKAFCPDKHIGHTKNFGFVLDARKNKNGSLELLHQIIGADRIKELPVNESSICTLKDVTDSDGDHYDELIDHNAILPNPQKSGLGGFIPVEPALAASRGQPINAEVFQLARHQEPTMDLTELRKALGAADSVSDADVLKQASAKLTSIPAIEQAKTEAESQITTLSRERDDAKLELSRRPLPLNPPDKDALLDRADLVLGRIELRVEKGDIPEAIAKRLRNSVKSDKGDPNVFMLSRAEGIDARPIDFVLSLFDGAKLGIETNLKLARDANPPNHTSEIDPENEKPVTPERKKYLLELAGVFDNK